MAKIIANDGGNFNGKMIFQVATGSNASDSYDSGHDVQLETALTLDDNKSATFTGNLFCSSPNPYLQFSGSGALRVKHTAGQTMYLRPDETGVISIFEGANSQTVYMMTQTPTVNSTANESAKLTFQTRSKQSDGQNNSKTATIKHLTHNIGGNLTNLDFAGSDKARFNMPIEAHGGLNFSSGTHIANNGVGVTSATATTSVASVLKANYSAVFFDFLIKNGTNVRAGTVTAAYDGTDVEFTETSTVDLGNTSDVTLSVVVGNSTIFLQAVTTSSTWTIKSLIRAL